MLISIAYQKYPCESPNSGISYGKYTNLSDNPARQISTRKITGFFVEFSSAVTIFDSVDNL